MQTASFEPRAINLKTAFTVAVICWLAPVVVLVSLGKILPAMALLPLPLVIGMLVSPTVAFYIFMLAVPVYLPYHLVGGAIWAFDLTMALLVTGLVMQFLMRGETEIRRTPVDVPFIFLIAATWLSAVFAYQPRESLVPSIRILVIFLAFRSIFTMTTRLGVRRVVLLYIAIVFALSVINIGLFIYYRGTERVFGPAWLAFENYSMTALPMALAFFIWSRSHAERVRFAVVIVSIAVAVAASQSRGTLVAIALGVPIMIFMAWRKINRDSMESARRSLNQVIAVAAVIGVLVIAFSSTLFFGFLGRVNEMLASVAEPQGTIALRIVLWTAAIKAWLTSPLVGIGIGNFNLVDQIVPEMKTAPVWYYIRGMSAHNVVLHYAAETGIFGVAALLAVTYRGLTMVRRTFVPAQSLEDAQVSGALLIAMAVFALSIFFMRAWTWAQEGYITAMIFGMAAAWWRQFEEKEPSHA